MSLTTVELEVGNVARPDVTETLEFLVDSGAIYSVVPAPVLERLGITPIAEQTFRLGGAVGVADVIFGEPGDATLLGAFTLEALGLALDPLKRELRPIPRILAAASQSSDCGSLRMTSPS